MKFIPATTARATSSGSTSGKAIRAFLPPSSNNVGFRVSDAARITARPVGTLPISVTMATPGWLDSAAPSSRPPAATLNTPGGNRWPTSSASRSADSDATSGGFMMTLLPAASGAAALAAVNMNGWLKATMRATTPTGSRTEKLTACGPIGMESPFISVTRPAKNSNWPAALAASIIASSSPCSRITAAARRTATAGSSGGTARQASKPCCAAATSAATSSPSPSGTSPSTSSVAGLRDSR